MNTTIPSTQLIGSDRPHHEQRRSYLDWLRMLAVLGVFYAHTIDSLDLLDWHVKYQERSVGIMALTNFGTMWGMSLMFLLAGSAVWFALGSRNGSQFIHERVMRLLLPFLGGILLLSPVEAYFEALRRSQYQGSFIQFVPHFFTTLQIGSDPRWLAAFGYHLWFLAFLFLISVTTLPLLLYLRRKAGRRFISWLAGVGEMTGGILLFALPLTLAQIALQAPFPGYQSWADSSFWLLSFLYGYLLAADTRFEHMIKSQSWLALLVGILGLLLIAVLYINGSIARWDASSSYSWGYISYQIVRGFTAWSLLALTLSFAFRFLNFSNRLLPYANEAVLPFYILHYPVIAIISFSLRDWHANPLARFLLVSTLSLALTLLIYDLLVRRIRILRHIFGMK